MSAIGYRCPCRTCKPPKRNADCHAECLEYIMWKKESDELSEAAKMKRDAERYTSQNAVREMRRKQRWR